MIHLWQAATALVGILVLMGLVSITLGLLATRRHFAKIILPPLPVPAPKISILKPVEGTSLNSYEAFASFCRLDYPGDMEIIIGTIRPDDPVVAMVERLHTAFPERKIQLVFAELLGTNRKTSIMEAMRQKASGQFLFFSDADIAAPTNYLRQLVPRLAQPEVGCLTCLPRGIEARTLGGKMVALHYGFNYLPQWMLAQQTTGIHWAIGHTMAVPRTVLEKLGGFKYFLNHLADDYELGHRVSQLGLRVIVPPLLLDCVVPAEAFAEAFVRMQRWKRTIRRSRGGQFPGIILTYPIFWALILALLQPCAWWSWSALAVVILIRWLLAAALQRVAKLPDWPGAWWLLPVVDIVEGITFFGAYLGSTITWAGRRYTLLRDGTLEPAGLKTRLESDGPTTAKKIEFVNDDTLPSSANPPSASLHRRRVRYAGKNPRRFEDKYKERDPQRYAATIAKVLASGKTPAGTHRPIMVPEILAVLEPRPGELAVDCTLGYGGHSQEILARLQPGGRLLGLDADPIELTKTEARLRAAGFGPEIFTAIRTNFAGLPQALASFYSLAAARGEASHAGAGENIHAPVFPGADCILADLGVSSMQIDDPTRGFSVKTDGPLDMRMNPKRGFPAAALLEKTSPAALAKIFQENADEPRAGELAEALAGKFFATTKPLTAAIRAALPLLGKDDLELAVRRVFQALRIAVNDEFSALDMLLRHLPASLNPGGRVAVLTFHSGEDRRVKKSFETGWRNGLYADIAHEVIRPSPDERRDNPRSSSAKLRWARKAG